MEGNLHGIEDRRIKNEFDKCKFDYIRHLVQRFKW